MKKRNKCAIPKKQVSKFDESDCLHAGPTSYKVNDTWSVEINFFLTLL